MELKNIQSAIDNIDLLPKLIAKIIEQKPKIDLQMVKLQNIDNHDVMNQSKRPQKKSCRTITNEDGTEVVLTEFKDVNRIPIPIQRFIAEMRANFLCANPVELDASPTTEIEKQLLEVMKKTWDDNKLDYETKELVTKQMLDCEVAEIWYTEDVDPGYWFGTPNKGKTKRLRMKVLNSNLGEELFPVYDKYGDMIAFARDYKLKVLDESFKEKEIEYFDIYTSDKNYFFQRVGKSWIISEPIRTNSNGKIPVIYYHQDKVESADVQPCINRKETLKSNHAGTNDYFGSPMAVFKGIVKGLPDKDDQGKAIELEGDGASAQYLTWDQSPASVKLEMDHLDTDIEVFTGTIAMTMEKMAGLGTFSGIALKILFMAAHLKAAQKEASFGKGIQRRINLLKSLLCELNQSLKPALNMSIKPKFTYFLPKNTVEDLDNIIKAKAAGLQTDETSVLQNPLIENGQAEYENLQKDLAPIIAPINDLKIA